MFIILVYQGSEIKKLHQSQRLEARSLWLCALYHLPFGFISWAKGAEGEDLPSDPGRSPHCCPSFQEKGSGRPESEMATQRHTAITDEIKSSNSGLLTEQWLSSTLGTSLARSCFELICSSANRLLVSFQRIAGQIYPSGRNSWHVACELCSCCTPQVYGGLASGFYWK